MEILANLLASLLGVLLLLILVLRFGDDDNLKFN